MHIHKHGHDTAPTVIILHPMGITGEKMYEVVGSKLGDYCVLTPDMGNHASEQRDFRSAAAEAAALHQYLVKRKKQTIRLLYGASLGAAVALNLLQYTDLKIENVYLDGAPVARLGLVMRTVFPPVLVWQKQMIANNREKGIADFVTRYGRDIAEHMADTFLQFRRTSINQIGKACVIGNTPAISPELQAHLWFDWGEKELYTKTSKPLVETLYPDAHIIVRSGCDHCEYMMKQNADYISRIKAIITENPDGSSI